MTNWHDSPIMIVKSADPSKHDGASLKKMLVEMEALLANGGYSLKSITECNGQIFVFLINEAELKRSKKRTLRTTASRAYLRFDCVLSSLKLIMSIFHENPLCLWFYETRSFLVTIRSSDRFFA